MQRPWRQEETVLGTGVGHWAWAGRQGPAPLLAPPTWQFICLRAGEVSGERRAEPTFEEAWQRARGGLRSPVAALLLSLPLLGPGLRLREFTGR